MRATRTRDMRPYRRLLPSADSLTEDDPKDGKVVYQVLSQFRGVIAPVRGDWSRSAWPPSVLGEN
jgi:hypothetical protein